MANQDIDVSRELLNRFDNDLAALTRLMSEALGRALILKSLLETLGENQELFTKR